MREVEVFGEKIGLSSDVPELVLMEFADVATGEPGEMQAKAAMFRLLKQCVVPADWARFRTAAIAKRADLDDLMEVITEAFAANMDLPSGPSVDYSAGLTSTGQRSTDGSSERVIAGLEAEARPGLGLFVVAADEERRAG